jgi:hypothetical protein
MTRKEIHAMSDFDLNCALLEYDEEHPIVTMPPDCCNDFNELRKIEEKLTPEQWAKHTINILEIRTYMVSTQLEAIEIEARRNSHTVHFVSGAWWGLRSTLRQRAEALLMTLTEAEA